MATDAQFLKRMIILLAVTAFGAVLAFLSYFGIVLPPIESETIEYRFFESTELADSKIHRAVAASLANENIPDVTDSFGTFSQNNFQAGKGIVLTVRKSITRPFYAGADNDFYEYVTIHLSGNPAAAGIYNVESPPKRGDMLALFADGSSYDTADACYGYPSAGTVALEPVSDDEIHVRINLKFTNDELYGNWNKYCDKKPINIDAVFSKNTVGGTPGSTGGTPETVDVIPKATE